MDNKFKIIDSHAHYDDESFNEDREEVLKQITENGVMLIIAKCAEESTDLKGIVNNESCKHQAESGRER